MNIRLIGYLLKVVTFCYCKRLYFREKSECSENFAGPMIYYVLAFVKRTLIFYLNISCFMLN